MADSLDKKFQIAHLQHPLSEQKPDVHVVYNAGLQRPNHDLGWKKVAPNPWCQLIPSERWPVAADGTFSIPGIGQFQVHIDENSRYVRAVKYYPDRRPHEKVKYLVQPNGDFTIEKFGECKLIEDKDGQFVRVRRLDSTIDGGNIEIRFEQPIQTSERSS